MSELVVFTDDEKDLLVGLIYAVGIWMSDADDTDEDNVSEQREYDHLVSSLKQLSSNNDITPLVREMVVEALHNDLKWDVWRARADAVLDDVIKALAVLRRHRMNDQVILHFKKVLMVVAHNVAKAFREEPENMPIETGFWNTISKGLNEFLMILGNKDRFQAMNISPAEDTNLTALFTTLKNN
jgi:hypothetical protein